MRQGCLFSCFALGLVFAQVCWVSAIQAEAEYVPPKPVDQEDQKALSRWAAYKGGEGWVLVLSSIDARGELLELSLLDATGFRELADVLLENGRKARFEPATLDGVPVADMGRIEGLIVKNGRFRSMRPKFYGRYRDAAEALNEGKMEAGRALIDELAAIEYPNFYEQLHLEALLVRYFLTLNEKVQAYKHADRVYRVLVSGFLEEERLPLHVLAPVIASKYLYEIDNLLMGNALRTAKLLELKFADFEMSAQIIEHAAGLNEMVSEKQFSTTISLLEPIYPVDYAFQIVDLYHREFQISDIRPGLHTLQLDCEEGRKGVPLENMGDDGWIVPRTWGRCTLSVVGEPGSGFTLTELPDFTLEPPPAT